MNATLEQMETLRNLSATAERMGFRAQSEAGFSCYSRAKVANGSGFQEEVIARSHGIREVIRWAHGSAVADSIK